MIDNNYIDRYIEHITFERHYSLHTIRAYQKDLLAFYELMSELLIDKMEVIDTDVIAEWIQRLTINKLSSRTISRKMSVVRSFFDFLIKKKIVSKNPLELFVSPKLTRTIPKVINEVDIVQMLQDMPTKTILDRRNKCMILMLYGTGIRSEELCTMTLSNLHIARQEVKVFGKGQKERIVPLIDVVAEYLRRWIGQDRKHLDQGLSDTVFLSHTGRALTTAMIRKIVDRFALLSSKHQDQKPHPHAFRYTFATHLLDNEVNIRHIQELLGHNSIATTERYTKISIKNLQQKFKQYHPRS